MEIRKRTLSFVCMRKNCDTIFDNIGPTAVNGEEKRSSYDKINTSLVSGAVW
jgi:hypothetical protein